jgi:hypothetical protein
MKQRNAQALQNCSVPEEPSQCLPGDDFRRLGKQAVIDDEGKL